MLAPNFPNYESMKRWMKKNLSSQAQEFYGKLTPGKFGKKYAGRTIQDLETIAKGEKVTPPWL